MLPSKLLMSGPIYLWLALQEKRPCSTIRQCDSVFEKGDTAPNQETRRNVMDKNDRQAIEALFDKLATVARQSPPRDGESEAFIRDKIARQPGVPCYMAQTIVVQEQALAAAEARLAELEAQAAEARPANGGSFESLLGDRRELSRSTGSVPRAGSANRESMQGQQPGGGGFLAGAAQTALGVTGGVLLGNAIAGMLGGHEAKAAEPATDKGTEDKGTEEPQEDANTEEAVYEDGAADFGDFDVDI
jgi:uncharacterized protein